MKKAFLGFVFAAAIGFSFTAKEAPIAKDNAVEVSEAASGKITMINDTSEKVKVHIGSGSFSLNPRGGKSSFSCDTGKKVKVNGSVIFTNNDQYCGETIYLSDFL